VDFVLHRLPTIIEKLRANAPVLTGAAF